jgi:hypothetical protein
MNNQIKILILSLLVAGANILSAADDKDSTHHSASMVSTVTFCEIGDIQTHVNAYKAEAVTKICSYIDSLAQGAPQFLADSVPVGGHGQPTDRSCAAFKASITSAIMAQEVYPIIDGTRVDLKQLQESVKCTSIAAVDSFVGVRLQRCGNEMLHPSVPSADKSSGGFMGGLFQ